MRGLTAPIMTVDDIGYNQSEDEQSEDEQSEDEQIRDGQIRDEQSEEYVSASLDSINEILNNSNSSRRYMNMWGGLCEETVSAQIRNNYYQPGISDNQTSVMNSSLYSQVSNLRSLSFEQMGSLSRMKNSIEALDKKIDKIEQYQKTIDEKLEFIIGSLNTLELEKLL